MRTPDSLQAVPNPTFGSSSGIALPSAAAGFRPGRYIMDAVGGVVHIFGCGAGQPGSNSRAGRSLSEDDYNRAFCASVGGRTEVRHEYEYPGGRSYVKVDCETDTHVYEGGLHKRSSLDSVQQALFFSHLTGKRPVVVIYDTDGQVGRFEYRIEAACDRVGVGYITLTI